MAEPREITAVLDELVDAGRLIGYVCGVRQDGRSRLAAGGTRSMGGPAMPEDAGLLVERVTRGRPRSAFNKLSLFDPDAIAGDNATWPVVAADHWCRAFELRDDGRLVGAGAHPAGRHDAARHGGAARRRQRDHRCGPSEGDDDGDR